MVYQKLKGLPELYEKDTKKVSERLPPNVTYDHSTKALTHTYTGGQQQTTKLDDLKISEVDLFAEKNFRVRAADETGSSGQARR